MTFLSLISFLLGVIETVISMSRSSRDFLQQVEGEGVGIWLGNFS